MRDLHQRQEEVREQIGRVRAAMGTHRDDEVKASINEALSELYASYDQAAERLQ
jgi:hypothetical protein